MDSARYQRKTSIHGLVKATKKNDDKQIEDELE